MGFREDAGAGGLLGLIGGLLSRREEVLEMRPLLADDGSHEMVALRVATAEGVYRVTVEPYE